VFKTRLDTGVIMKKIIILNLFFYSFSLFSAVPTMEGLFRNGVNEAISGNLVVFDLLVTEQPKIQEVEEKPKENFLKLVFFQDDDKSTKVFQFQYPDSQMNDQKISHFAKVLNLSGKLKNDPNTERAVLFSILSMIGLNNSNPITYVLKKYNQDFRYNREILNGEKLALYRQYKSFISDKERNTKESPLNPLKQEDKARVDELVKSSIYRQTGNVKLIKRDGEFYWFIDLSRSSALFSNNNHLIKEMKILLPKGSIELDFDDYISFNGAHMVPGQIMIKDSNERLYKIKITGFNISQTNSSKIEEKYKDVQIMGASPAENSFPSSFLFL
jgi:hypothetical protein